MDDEKLLDLVQTHDIIYNKSHRYHNNCERKKLAWERIASELDASVDDVVKRYRGLRDRFVKYKKTEFLTGYENKYRAPILDRMEFLTPFVFNKSASGEKVTWTLKEDNSFPDPINITSLSHLSDDEANSFIEISSPPPEPINRLKSVKRKYESSRTSDANVTCPNVDDADEAFADALNCYKKLCKSREERLENQALHGFGQMIIATIAEMSPQQQTKAMLRVTELVMTMRMEEEEYTT